MIQMMNDLKGSLKVGSQYVLGYLIVAGSHGKLQPFLLALHGAVNKIVTMEQNY